MDIALLRYQLQSCNPRHDHADKQKSLERRRLSEHQHTE